MHELAIAESIAEVVARRANEHKATHVALVRLRIGDASGVVPDSLTFCFEMVASLDPLLAGARLAVDSVPHRAHCRGCDREFAVRDFVAQCPACGEWSDEIVSGTELQVMDMEIETRQEGV
ncbi:MAG: hydrogenase maturation nickel metallochaperone HypA [Ktedonobacterales bacterium]